jgi:CRP-like cAMP-binding protein
MQTAEIAQPTIVPSATPAAVVLTDSSAQNGLGRNSTVKNVLEGLLVDAPGACGFDSLAVEARSPLPASWLSRYSFAMVRRGYLIRQRTDHAGRTTAIDAVGPGCCFPLEHAFARQGESPISGYAVTRASVCLCDHETLERGLAEGGTTPVQVHKLDGEAIARMERLADARGRPGAASKVAALLCALADTLRPGANNNGEPQTVPGEFLQRDLANLLSIRHESVCRAMREFGKDALIAKDGSGIVLLKREQLEAL